MAQPPVLAPIFLVGDDVSIFSAEREIHVHCGLVAGDSQSAVQHGWHIRRGVDPVLKSSGYLIRRDDNATCGDQAKGEVSAIVRLTFIIRAVHDFRHVAVRIWRGVAIRPLTRSDSGDQSL